MTASPDTQRSQQHAPEDRESLWALIAAPAIWGGHFLLSYVTAAVWCAKFAGPSRSLGPVRIAVAGYTFIAMIGIAVTAWRGWSRGRPGRRNSVRPDDAWHVRRRFLGFASLLLSVLSAIATLFVAAVLFFMRTCD